MPKRSMQVHENSVSEWMLTNGSAVMNASTLNASLLHPLQSNSPPTGMADITKALNISQMGILTWVMSRDSYTEAATPILYGNSSDGWNANTTLHLPSNATIDLIMAVANDSMDTVRPRLGFESLRSLTYLRWATPFTCTATNSGSSDPEADSSLILPLTRHHHL